MKVTVPAWYHQFRCIADRCTDSCCIGWEIDIDEKARARFEALTGDFGEYVRARIDFSADPPHMILDGERCPFLNEQGLCEMILHEGEDILCDICARHPRFYEWFGDECEAGLGMCCEEAARLWLTVPEPFAFTTYESDETPDEREFDPGLLRLLRLVRSQMLVILESKKLALNEKLALVLEMAEEVQDTLDKLDPSKYGDEIRDIVGDSRKLLENDEKLRDELIEMREMSEPRKAGDFRQVLKVMASFDPIHPAWPARLHELAGTLKKHVARPQPLQAFAESHADVLARVMGYYICRYLLKAVYTEDVFSPVRFGVLSVMTLIGLAAQTGLKTGQWSQADWIDLLKMCSQELEYDPDCFEAIAETEEMGFAELLDWLMG